MIMSQLDAYIYAGFPALVAVIFGLGFASGLSPCSLPTVALVIAYVGNNGNRGKLHGFLLALSFVIGIALVLTIIGGFSGFLGGLLTQGKSVFAKGAIGLRIFVSTVSVIFILLGLWMMQVINFDGFNLMGRMNVDKGSGARGAFLLGLPFGIAASPCTLPVTIAVLLFLAARGNVLESLLLMFIYAIGRSVPILAAGTFTGILARINGFSKWQKVIEKIGGSVMITIGIYFFFRTLLGIDLLKIISIS